MPLTARQKQQIDRHIRAYTSYSWASRWDVTPISYITTCVEQMMDAKWGYTRDLFLPDELINADTHRESFWFCLARVLSEDRLTWWHALELGPRGCRRMVFTWRTKDGEFRFYTKGLLRGGPGRDLIWYASKASSRTHDEGVHSEADTDVEDVHSEADTDDEDINTRTVP